jgi:hypothetical protein
VASGGSGVSTGGTGSLPTSCSALIATDVISDFEGGTAKLNPVAGRDGSWFIFDDGTGTSTPVKIPNTPLDAEAGGACDSAYAFHTTGSGYSDWGAGIGTDFVPKVAEVRQTYDVSSYSAIGFRAKAAAPVEIRLSISDQNTAEEGGVCNPTAVSGDPDRCGDYFGTNVVLSTEWEDYTVPFASMTQRGWGLPAPGFDATTAYSLRMQVRGDAATPVSFDYWLDDVYLVP